MMAITVDSGAAVMPLLLVPPTVAAHPEVLQDPAHLLWVVCVALDEAPRQEVHIFDPGLRADAANGLKTRCRPGK